MSTLATAAPLPPRREIVPNAILATTVFVIAESMFFAGLISAHTIVKAGTVGVWPPVGQPRLPAEETLLNTGLLLLSGVLLAVAVQLHKRTKKGGLPLVVASFLLGAAFVGLQGREWSALLRQGLTMTSSAHGSFFYLIVGAHALHAIAGLLILLVLCLKMYKRQESPGRLGATTIYWYFVVLLWPILYLKVYL
jgi:cytochrome c oxidase subunit 3